MEVKKNREEGGRGEACPHGNNKASSSSSSSSPSLPESTGGGIGGLVCGCCWMEFSG